MLNTFILTDMHKSLDRHIRALWSIPEQILLALCHQSDEDDEIASIAHVLRLRNDLYCVEWGVKLYSLTHSIAHVHIFSKWQN